MIRLRISSPPQKTLWSYASSEPKAVALPAPDPDPDSRANCAASPAYCRSTTSTANVPGFGRISSPMPVRGECGLHLRRGQEQALGLRIERHGLGALLGLDVSDGLIFIRALLANHGHSAVTVGGEDQLVVRIKGHGIDPIADGKRRDHLAALGVHNCQHLAPAADKEPGVGERRWPFPSASHIR